MHFKVTLERPTKRPGQRSYNPFIRSIATVSLLTREWEMEAADEAEIREYLAEAIADDLPNVRGFRLRSIERLDG